MGEPITLARMQSIAAQLNGTYINVDGASGNQCWDSAARVSQLLGLPIINTWNTTERKGRWPGWAGNMWDCFPQTAEIAAAYRKVGADQPALPGDKAIWGDSDPYYPATHVADVIQDAGALLLCISQNSSAGRPDLPGYSRESAGPTIIQHLPKRGLLGYLRPTVAGEIIYQSTTTEAGDDDMPITDDDANKIAKALINYNLNRQGAGQSGQVNLGAVIAWYDANRVYDNQETARAAADKTLNTPIRRGGKGAGLGEYTSLGAVTAWHDHGTLEIIAAAGAGAASNGATVEEIKAAMVEAMKGTVKVEVSVEGGAQ